jgi:hypothetical protein
MKLPGVESAEVSLDKASADIRLKADNRITMPQLREVLKKNGYPTRDARIEGRGRVVERNGKLVLDLLNDSWLDLAADPANPSRAGRTLEIAGVSRAAGKAAESVTLTGAR